MAQIAVPFTRVQELITRAEEQGCEVRTSKRMVMTPYGTKKIRFLYNPANRGRFDITDFDNDEYMCGSEVMAAERRLGIRLSH